MSSSKDRAAKTSSWVAELTALSSSATSISLADESGLASSMSIASATSLSLAELYPDERLQALIGVIDGGLGGVAGSGCGPGGEGREDGIRDNIGCHGGCNCATDHGRTIGELALALCPHRCPEISVDPSGQPSMRLRRKLSLRQQRFRVMCR
jgi:hypothetical protein